tara:strand:- start:2412 stop:3275 length:864 start_codon:yes stop_codon:yes gene_type:complete
MSIREPQKVVEDIYRQIDKLNDGPLDISEDLIEEFGEAIKDVIRSWSVPQQRDGFTLRMSNIGRPMRQLWFDKNSKINNNKILPATFIKFLYGHLLEELVLLLAKMSGHEVTDQQKEIDVSGIKGHMDCKIDGEVVDIKSASGFSFSKFSKGLLSDEDPFGYLTQLAAYEHAEGTNNGGFLAINKETGELAFYQPEELDKPNVKQRIKDLKHKLDLVNPPELCYAPIPEGKSGNMRIAKNCVYCPHKFECHKDSNDGEGLRVFKYSKGPMYFTKVVKKPKVDEVYEP